MTSNNKLFKNYLHQQSSILGKRLKDTDFITKSRTEWNAMSEEKKLSFANTDTNSKVISKPSDVHQSEPRLPPSIRIDSDPLDFNQEIESQIFNSLISMKDLNQLMDTKFFFMASNIQCLTLTGEYIPIEIGIIEYTIRDGIRRNYHQFIDCGPVPEGFYNTAEEQKKIHKIPLKDFVLSSKDYQQIGSSVLEFLSESCANDLTKQGIDNPLIVFSKSNQLRQNIGSLKWIAKMAKEVNQKSGQDFKLNAKVLNASKLLAELLMAAKEVQPSKWCEDVLSSSVYDYMSGTDCGFHEEIDCIQCGLGVAKRISYLISKCLTKSFNIKLKSTHIPVVKGFENIRFEAFYEREPEFDVEEFKRTIENDKKTRPKVDEWLEESDPWG